MPPHITGKAIVQGGRDSMVRLAEASFGTELIYSFIIIACSLMIYFGTKELYELSNHKGLKYFRLAFLFFALAYFFRSFIKFTLMTISQVPLDFKISPNNLTFVLFIYFSIMAIFYLLYSVIHKKFDKKPKTIFIFHIISILTAILIITLRNPLFYLLLNLTLLAFIILTFYISKNKKKKKNSLHIIYTLMTIFWALNILDILIPNFFRTAQIIIYLASLSTFLAMLYKVLRKTGST